MSNVLTPDRARKNCDFGPEGGGDDCVGANRRGYTEEVNNLAGQNRLHILRAAVLNAVKLQAE